MISLDLFFVLAAEQSAEQIFSFFQDLVINVGFFQHFFDVGIIHDILYGISQLVQVDVIHLSLGCAGNFTQHVSIQIDAQVFG